MWSGSIEKDMNHTTKKIAMSFQAFVGRKATGIWKRVHGESMNQSTEDREFVDDVKKQMQQLKAKGLSIRVYTL